MCIQQKYQTVNEMQYQQMIGSLFLLVRPLLPEIVSNKFSNTIKY